MKNYEKFFPYFSSLVKDRNLFILSKFEINYDFLNKILEIFGQYIALML